MSNRGRCGWLSWPLLVLYGYAFFARTRDKMHFNITVPNGFAIEYTQGIEKHNRICFSPLKKGPKSELAPWSVSWHL